MSKSGRYRGLITRTKWVDTRWQERYMHYNTRVMQQERGNTKTLFRPQASLFELAKECVIKNKCTDHEVKDGTCA